ncbi:MAG: T9SS type A sorting domain-containing protein, partial [Cytophagaceae bacterium]|nr:T9SS type A sorting domain-containing protein [Cytophagaceae bacterium]MDW8457470.1 T9SS type A sorting domain-containing protein [Cytophagaceae bacterium]
VSPWYGQYCKRVSRCTSSARMQSMSQLWPNPAEEEFSITSEVEIEEVIVYNEVGVQVYCMTGIRGSEVTVGRDLPSGIYHVLIRYTSGETESKRVQVVK